MNQSFHLIKLIPKEQLYSQIKPPLTIGKKPENIFVQKKAHVQKLAHLELTDIYQIAQTLYKESLIQSFKITNFSKEIF